MSFKPTERIILAILLMVATVLIMTGCATSPQERRGVSNIPFNSPDNNETRTFDGRL